MRRDFKIMLRRNWIHKINKKVFNNMIVYSNLMTGYLENRQIYINNKKLIRWNTNKMTKYLIINK